MYYNSGARNVFCWCLNHKRWHQVKKLPFSPHVSSRLTTPATEIWTRSGTTISSVRFRLVTVGKLAWPASSDAAALAVSCLSEWPVPSAAGRSERIYRQQNCWTQSVNSIFTHAETGHLQHLRLWDMGSCSANLKFKMKKNCINVEISAGLKSLLCSNHLHSYSK